MRIDGRSIIQIDSEEGPRIRPLFELYAYGGHTIDSLVETQFKECVVFSKATPRFTHSKVHHILRDRAYIGEINHKGQWLPGKQDPLIDRATWDRTQFLLGDKVYRSEELTYAGELILCAHCGHPITGELKIKKTKTGEREYAYYRCAKYTAKDHPRVRVTEADLDAQVLALFRKMKIGDEKVRNWFSRALHARAKDSQAASQARLAELTRQHSTVLQQLDRLLNLRILDEINENTFAAKNTELRDREAHIRLEIDAASKGHAEYADLAINAFELSQRLEEKWTCADYQSKRQILEIICLNFTLDGVTLCPEMRKPFDVLAEGLVLKRSRGDRI
ncbi:MAG: recombinase family protein [Planctomycetota bacterium]